MGKNFRLDGMSALVTGCRSGIGRAIALTLAGAGADIIGVSSNLSTGDSEVGAAVMDSGVGWFPYRYDLSDKDQLYECIDSITTEHPNIDILVNNAGIIHRAPLEHHTDQLWNEVINLNLTVPFILSREIGKRMAERRKGKVICIASLLSFQGGITVPGYAASKGGIRQLIMALSNELAGKGVCVNGIAPGYIRTAATEALQKDPIRSKAILDRIPAGRWGEAEDIAGAALFLSSELASYVTGTIITVDGGWMGR